MRLLFNGQGKYTDFSNAYWLYLNRARGRQCLSEKDYRRVIRAYCKRLADRLLKDGSVDLPDGLGTITAAELTRKPQWRGDRFVGYGAYDWKTGQYDGERKAFGIVFLPSHRKRQNLRCYGFVANKRLFRKMKELHDRFDCPWTETEFNDDMI